jgi:SAM-dependent methyltransferase
MIQQVRRVLRKQLRAGRFRDSASYWEHRYAKGGTSGAGSYGRLAAFKAGFMNGFLAEHGVNEVIELGCGDGAQLALIDYRNYTGVDVSDTIVARCRERFADRPAWRFFHRDEPGYRDRRYNLALSMDVLFHLVENCAFEAYLDDLFRLSRRYVVIYSCNHDGPVARGASHVRARRFTEVIARRYRDWPLTARVANSYPYNPEQHHETSWCDFFVFASREEADGRPAALGPANISSRSRATDGGLNVVRNASALL